MKRQKIDITGDVCHRVSCLKPLNFRLPDGTEDIGSVDNVALSLFVHNYARKLEGGSVSDPVLQDLTLKKWYAAEQRCEVTTARIRSAKGPYTRFLWRVQEIITSIIGDAPNLGRLHGKGAFSQGASFGTKRGTHQSVKMEQLQMTACADSLAYWFIGLADHLEFVRGARMAFVPKSADVLRPIGIEPSGNVFFQKAVGNYIRECLCSVGCNLDDQTKNQQLAFEAYADGLATIDLESASDSVSIGLVEAVLPPAWLELMHSLRSKEIRLPSGKWRELSKFSAMGNGFTFELESLIFYSCCKALLPDGATLAVYGDDIIVPQQHAKHIIHMLEYVGFVTNKDKSFVTGAFFESCGKYYYKLEDVTPCFQKARINCLAEAFRAYNRLIRWKLRTKCSVDIKPILQLILNAFPSPARIPYGSERDDGYLTPHENLRVNRHGDFICTVAHFKSITDLMVNERNAYRYKLFKPDNLNEDPKGYSRRDAGRSVLMGLRKTAIWASSLS